MRTYIRYPNASMTWSSEWRNLVADFQAAQSNLAIQSFEDARQISAAVEAEYLRTQRDITPSGRDTRLATAVLDAHECIHLQNQLN